MPKPNRRTEIRGPGGSLQLPQEDPVAPDLAMLIAGETSGRPLDEVLAEFRCARSTYYEKLRRLRDEGSAGLQPRSPGPRGPWRRTADIVRFVVTARLSDPTRSAASNAEALQLQGERISLRSVERTLAHFGLSRGSDK